MLWPRFAIKRLVELISPGGYSLVYGLDCHSTVRTCDFRQIRNDNPLLQAFPSAGKRQGGDKVGFSRHFSKESLVKTWENTLVHAFY